MNSIPTSVGIDIMLDEPVISLEFVIPLTLIGISLFESSIVPTITPLLAAYSCSARMPVFFPESETFELSNSNSMLVEEFDASDFV